MADGTHRPTSDGTVTAPSAGVDRRAGAGNAGRCRTGSRGPVMRKQGLVRAGIVVGALAGLVLVRLLAYHRANLAPDPSTLPQPLPGPPPGPDDGVGVVGADGRPLTDVHGKPVLVRFSDLTGPPPEPPREIHLPPDPAGTVRSTRRSWFHGMTGVVEVPP